MSAAAVWVDLSGGQKQPGTPPDIDLLQSDALGSSYFATVYGFYMDTVEIAGGSYSKLSLPGATHLIQTGPGITDPFANLGVSPSFASQVFTIRVPTYALSLQVIDASGRVLNQNLARRGELLWPGTDQQGRQLAEGIYFIKATGRDRTEVKKVLLVR